MSLLSSKKTGISRLEEFEHILLARTCNVATDRLVYQDVHGLSATEPCLRARIWGRIKPKDTGTPRELGLVNRPSLSWGPNRPYLAPAV